jgi:hypothetical protein
MRSRLQGFLSILMLIGLPAHAQILSSHNDEIHLPPALRLRAPAPHFVPILGGATPPVAMFPAPGETNRQTSGSAVPDPGYEKVLRDAFAERDRRAMRADSMEKSAKDARDHADALRERERVTGTSSYAAVIAQHNVAAEKADALARLLRPKTAPPLSEADKAANALRLAQMAPSGRDGYCQELLKPSPGAVAVGVVCACGERYRDFLLHAIHALEDKADKYVVDGNLADLVKADRAAGQGPGDGDFALADQAQLHRSVRLTEAQNDFSAACKKVAYRESDPRRRLVPVSLMYGYEHGGQQDRAARQSVYSGVQHFVQQLADLPEIIGRVRVFILRDVAKNRAANKDYESRFAAVAARYYPQYVDLMKKEVALHGAVEAYISGTEPGQAIGRELEAAMTPICNARLQQEKQFITTIDDALVGIVSDYRADRAAALARIDADMPLWEGLAKRNGPSDIDFAAVADYAARPGTSHWPDVDLSMSVGGRAGPGGQLIRGVGRDKNGAWDHETCNDQYAALVDSVRALPQSARSNVAFGQMGMPQPFRASPDYDDTNYNVGVSLWLDPNKPKEPPLKEVADLQTAQGGRYPEDGP